MNRQHKPIFAAIMALYLGAVVYVVVSTGPQRSLSRHGDGAPRDVIATVGDRQLTLADLPVRVDELGEREPGEAYAVIRRALDDLIDTELLVAEAERIGLALDDEDLAALRRDEPRPEIVERESREDGITVEEYRLRRRHRQLALRVIEHEVYPSVPVLPHEIETYAREHSTRYRTPSRYRLRGLFVSSPTGSAPVHVDDARRRAEQAAAQLARGAGFANVARKYSDGLEGAGGGVLGDVMVGDPPLDVPALAAAVTDLAPGEVSEVVSTDMGFWIVQLEAKLPPEDLPDEVRLRRAENDLRAERGERLVRTYLDRLRARAQVSVLLPEPEGGDVPRAVVRP
jgi:hypothetical protein